MVDMNTKKFDSNKYSINFLRVKTMIVTKYILKSRNVPDIGYIPISSEDYKNESKNLTHEKNESIIFTDVISPLQQEFKLWNDN